MWMIGSAQVFLRRRERIGGPILVERRYRRARERAKHGRELLDRGLDDCNLPNLRTLPSRNA